MWRGGWATVLRYARRCCDHIVCDVEVGVKGQECHPAKNFRLSVGTPTNYRCHTRHSSAGEDATDDRT
eukprot:9325629-Prorocentrum_lima.AAC.1